jgi:hypothetical protein
MRRSTPSRCPARQVCDPTKPWSLVRGQAAGCTHVASCTNAIGAGGDDTLFVWEHPLDLQLATQKLEVRVSCLQVTRDDLLCSMRWLRH